jgi:hypothetical protein
MKHYLLFSVIKLITKNIHLILYHLKLQQIRFKALKDPLQGTKNKVLNRNLPVREHVAVYFAVNAGRPLFARQFVLQKQFTIIVTQ